MNLHGDQRESNFQERRQEPFCKLHLSLAVMRELETRQDRKTSFKHRALEFGASVGSYQLDLAARWKTRGTVE